MAGWLPGGRDHDRRLEALELELERLRAKSSADADRLAELATSVNRVADQIVSFSERLTTVADEAGEARANAAKLEEAIEAGSLGEARLKVEHEAMAATLGTMTEDLERLRGLDETVRALEAAEQQAKSDREELVKLRVAIKRAERQLELNADESRKTAAALLERVEALRGTPSDQPGARSPLALRAGTNAPAVSCRSSAGGDMYDERSSSNRTFI